MYYTPESGESFERIAIAVVEDLKKNMIQYYKSKRILNTV